MEQEDPVKNRKVNNVPCTLSKVTISRASIY